MAKIDLNFQELQYSSLQIARSRDIDRYQADTDNDSKQAWSAWNSSISL